MRLILFFAAGAFLIFGAGTALGDCPFLPEGVTIMDGADPLDKGPQSNPCMVDWNNDGKKDLLVGVYTLSNNIWLFINQGTNSNPVFNGGVNVESNGVPISVTAG
ncbi:MAG: hypothetical protein ACYTG7_02860 [Planctomycetota bacterium]|jgi:hypothetical protein